jgi:lantibiotic modifying enzyme
VTAPLEAAHTIASGLAATAVWHGDRCTWLGAMADAEPPHTVLLGTLGCDLYAGLAGVGLVLAETGVATGDRALARAAGGAVRQALEVAARTPPGPGLFDGAAGLALAAARTADLLGDDRLRASAHGAAHGLADAPAAGFDLVGGRAGTALALRALARALGDPSLDEGAVRVARALLDGATRRAEGISWSDPAGRWPDDLTGMSHGAAGAALALTEAGFTDAAAEALRYEDTWWDRGLGTWRDVRALREVPVPTTTAAWCHGAPGMVLARVRIAALGGPPPGPTGVAGLAVLHRCLAAALAGVGANLSLCHGLCGLAETAALADPVAGATAVGAAAAVVTGLMDDGVPLPCGVPGGDAPGLMAGVAGIARTLLAAAGHRPPSVLLIRPEEWAPGSGG